MANTGFKGLSVRQTGNQLLIEGFFQDSTGAKVTTGTGTYALYELQSDGTLKSYDFNDNTFKTTALTTATAALTHRTGNNGTVNTGIWTAALATLTGFTAGGVYFIQANNALASPPDQVRKFQYGSAEGDLIVTAGAAGQAYVQSDTQKWLAQTVQVDASNVPVVDTWYIASSLQSAGNYSASGVTVNTLSTNIYQSLGRMFFGCKGKPWFVRVGGNDGSAGTSPATAFATLATAASASVAGDEIVIGAGTIVDTSTNIIPVAAAVRGAGMYETVVTQAYTNNAIGVFTTAYIFSDGVVVRDMTIQSTGPGNSSSTYTFLISTADNATVTFERVRFIGKTDIVYLTGTNQTLIFEDCVFDTNWDWCFVEETAGTATLIFRRCRMTSTGPRTYAGAGISSGLGVIASSGTRIIMQDCDVRLVNNAYVNPLITCQSNSGTNVIDIIGGSVTCESGTALTTEIEQAGTANTINLWGVAGTPSKWSGSQIYQFNRNVTVSGLAANVITAASIASDADAEIGAAVWADSTGAQVASQLSGVNARVDVFVSSRAVAGDQMGLTAGTITSIQSGMATSTALSTAQTAITAIKVVTDKESTMLAASGGNYTFTVDALKNAPSSGGVSRPITIVNRNIEVTPD